MFYGFLGKFPLFLMVAEPKILHVLQKQNKLYIIYSRSLKTFRAFGSLTIKAN